jgi:hypothetical protein
MINAELPQLIAGYLQAANAHKRDWGVLAFWEDVLVTDENQEHRGLAAIREWSERGAIVKWFGSSIDIDDRKRAEERIWQTTQNLQRSEFYLQQGQQLTLRKLVIPSVWQMRLLVTGTVQNPWVRSDGRNSGPFRLCQGRSPRRSVNRGEDLREHDCRRHWLRHQAADRSN